MRPSLAYWLDSHDGGSIFTTARDLIRAHPEDCPSLDHAWLPRKGGFSCITDSYPCDGCGVTFFWEGLNVVHEACPYTNHWVCTCCIPVFACGCTE